MALPSISQEPRDQTPPRRFSSLEKSEVLDVNGSSTNKQQPKNSKGKGVS